MDTTTIMAAERVNAQTIVIRVRGEVTAASDGTKMRSATAQIAAMHRLLIGPAAATIMNFWRQ